MSGVHEERRCKRKREEHPLKHPVAFLPGIGSPNESRPQVNMPLGCQSIPVTCNTNTQNLLSYKINVLLVPPCIALDQSHWSPLRSSAACVREIMVKWSHGLGYSISQVSCLYDLSVITRFKMRKFSFGKAINFIYIYHSVGLAHTDILLILSSMKNGQEKKIDNRSKLYSVHFKPWMLIFLFFFSRLKLYLFCIQESKKNNCTTPQGWQRKSFCHPLKSVLSVWGWSSLWLGSRNNPIISLVHINMC